MLGWSDLEGKSAKVHTQDSQGRFEERINRGSGVYDCTDKENEA